MDTDKIITQRLNAIEGALEDAIKILVDVYSQKSLVEYLLLLKEEEKK